MVREPWRRSEASTLSAWRRALEMGGVLFIDPDPLSGDNSKRADTQRGASRAEAKKDSAERLRKLKEEIRRPDQRLTRKLGLSTRFPTQSAGSIPHMRTLVC